MLVLLCRSTLAAVGMHSVGESGKIADVYAKFGITAEAVTQPT